VYKPDDQLCAGFWFGVPGGDDDGDVYGDARDDDGAVFL
jgi:hypothetical protein